jgi:hypothetical protein
MPDYVPEQFEPIKNIEFEAEQIWPDGEPIKKIKIEFSEEEHMMLLILNIFVHDFGHDYNFLGDSYLKRIVSNIKELELLGIKNGNKILKKLTDIISSEPRVPSMYNDNIFVDAGDPEYLSEALKNKKQKFNERLNGFEIATKKQQLKEVGEELDKKFVEQESLAAEAKLLSSEKQEEFDKKFVEQESLAAKAKLLSQEERGRLLGKEKMEGGELQPTAQEVRTTTQTAPPPSMVDIVLYKGKQDALMEGLGTGSKKTSFEVVVPSLSSLKIDISDYIKARANDPDSLEMLSTLKLYITSYLGPNYYTSLIPETVDPTSEAFYKYYTHYSTITTFYGLICYYDEIVEEKMVDEQLSILTTLFSDLLLILLASYLEFVNSKGDDYFSREDAVDPLSILDSDEVMNNYNRLFAEYVQSSDSQFDEFKSTLLSDYEIIEDVKEVKIGGQDTDDEGAADVVEQPKYRHTYVKRQYGVFHNNLLTTVARGIFLKTGIWQKIYPPTQGDKARDFPSQFVYNPASSKDVSQQFEDWKTNELSLITSITRDTLKASGFKNDLLIAEILILKHMLIEILPDFLYLANGIDDRLRNFLEVYLYKCGNYDADDLKELSEEDNTILCAALEQEATEADLKFIASDDEEEVVERGGSLMKGGVNYGEGTIYNLQRKVGSYEVPTLFEKKKTQPLSKEDVERAFKLNNDVIRNLTESGIPDINLEDGTKITNLFDLLKMNLGMIKREGSDFAFPAPKRRFILDNASKLTRNVNGLKLFHDKDALKNLKFESELEKEKLLKEFRAAQKFFGLYKTLKRGVVCAGSSMLDAMDNCSLDKGATEPKEVGTTNFEFVFDDPATGKHFSYGGVVLFYKGKNKGGEDNINVHIDFSLKTKFSREEQDDVAHVVVDELDVADSEDLKARIVYKSVIEEVNALFKNAFRFEEVPIPDHPDQFDLDQEFIKRMRELAIIKMRSLWSFLQYNPYLQTNPVFNRLLGKTGVKNLGDLLQESQGTIKWGGYVNTIDGMDDAVKEFIRDRSINVEEDIIWRSVSKKNAIIPYDENGDALRLAVEGDRPSAFRAIYFVLFALTTGPTEGINLMTIAGYLNGHRSILVSRNQPYIDVEPPPRAPELVGPIPLELVASDPNEEGDRDEEILAQVQAEADALAQVQAEADALAQSQTTAKPKPKRTKDLTKEEAEEIARAKADDANEALNSLQLDPYPIPAGKVIYVNSEKKNINFKATVINDPQIKRPKTLAEQVKKITEVKTKTKSAKPPGSPLSTEKIATDTQKLERDSKDLISQVTFGNSIPKFSELKKQSEDAEAAAATFASMPFHREGGKTRKHKKPLKKKTNTRNKNKTKKVKKGKKTIKRRKVAKKKHQKTR